VHKVSTFMPIQTGNEPPGIGGSLPFWRGMNVEMLCRVLVVRCRSE
jgi:hypothetical protein